MELCLRWRLSDSKFDIPKVPMALRPVKRGSPGGSVPSTGATLKPVKLSI